MCGIAGICGLAPVNRAAVAAMAEAMAHRGPDDRGLWASEDGRLVLGHARLAIIDRSSGGHQPMVAAGGRRAVVFNGEIYNYRELRAELAAEGVSFGTDSDTEVLLAAYERWGDAFVSRLNGMFAFALADLPRRRILFARDRFGEKPLLWASGAGFFAFASEYRALLGLAGVDATVDEARLARFLAVPADGLDRGETTLFAGIRQLPAGHVMALDCADLSVKVWRYWEARPDPDAAGLGVAEAAGRFRELLTDSIRLRLRSDVPVGSCLSGGLDSGAIACLVRRELGDGAPYHVFSGRFPQSPADEGPFMDAIAEQVRPIRHDVAPSPDRLLEELGRFAWMNELPVDSASQYAQYSVFRLARENGITVLLDGQGADEVLGGYEQYFAAYLRGTEDPAERSAIQARYPGALDHVKPWHARLPVGLRRLLAHATGRGSDLAFGLRPELADGLRPPPKEDLQGALRRDSLDGFLATLLRYGDRNSMAHSVEVRLPFCDHRLFEFAQGLAPAVLMGDAETKRLLRESMRGILPEPVRTRWRKQGFLPPHEAWMAGPLLPAIRQLCESPGFTASPLWQPQWWRRAVRRLEAGDTRMARPLWKVLSAEMWRNAFVAPMAAIPKIPPLSHAPCG